MAVPDPASGIAGHCGGLGQRVWERTVHDSVDDVLSKDVYCQETFVATLRL